MRGDNAMDRPDFLLRPVPAHTGLQQRMGGQPQGRPSGAVLVVVGFLVACLIGAGTLGVESYLYYPTNIPPVVNVVADSDVEQPIAPGTMVRLIAYGYDADLDQLYYRWTQIDGPNIPGLPTGASTAFTMPSKAVALRVYVRDLHGGVAHRDIRLTPSQ